MTRMQRRCVAFVLGVEDEVLRHAKLGLQILAAACRKSPMFKEVALLYLMPDRLGTVLSVMFEGRLIVF